MVGDYLWIGLKWLVLNGFLPYHGYSWVLSSVLESWVRYLQGWKIQGSLLIFFNYVHNTYIFVHFVKHFVDDSKPYFPTLHKPFVFYVQCIKVHLRTSYIGIIVILVLDLGLVVILQFLFKRLGLEIKKYLIDIMVNMIVGMKYCVEVGKV